MTIYHVATEAAWNTALDAGQYRADSLQSEGFIHFSTAKQVELVLNTFYHGQQGLLLLVVDEARLAAPLQYDENVAPDGTLDHFPHLYGPLNLDAVSEIYPLTPGPTGNFDLGD